METLDEMCLGVMPLLVCFFSALAARYLGCYDLLRSFLLPQSFSFSFKMTGLIFLLFAEAGLYYFS
jgi:hypothetical protein